MVFRFDDDNGAIDAAGRFQFRGIIGRAIFVTGFKDYNVRKAGWSMKSVTLNGADITDTPIDIPSVGEISGIEITLTDTLTRLSGKSRTRAAKQSTIRRRHSARAPQEGVLPGRFTRTARPNQEGRYEIRGLPAATTSPSRSRHSNLATSGIPHSANRSSPEQNVFD